MSEVMCEVRVPLDDETFCMLARVGFHGVHDYIKDFEGYRFHVCVMNDEHGKPEKSFFDVSKESEESPIYHHQFSVGDFNYEIEAWYCYLAFREVLEQNSMTFPEGMVYDQLSMSFIAEEEEGESHGA